MSKTFTPDEVHRLKRLVDISFRGGHLGTEEIRFLEYLLKKNDKLYGEISGAVRNQIRAELTRPLG